MIAKITWIYYTHRITWIYNKHTERYTIFIVFISAVYVQHDHFRPAVNPVWELYVQEHTVHQVKRVILAYC